MERKWKGAPGTHTHSHTICATTMTTPSTSINNLLNTKTFFPSLFCYFFISVGSMWSRKKFCGVRRTKRWDGDTEPREKSRRIKNNSSDRFIGVASVCHMWMCGPCVCVTYCGLRHIIIFRTPMTVSWNERKCRFTDNSNVNANMHAQPCASAEVILCGALNVARVSSSASTYTHIHTWLYIQTTLHARFFSSLSSSSFISFQLLIPKSFNVLRKRGRRAIKMSWLEQKVNR